VAEARIGQDREVRNSVASGVVTGIDPSEAMVEQARARNANAIRAGRVELGTGSV